MDTLTRDLQHAAPWTLLYADDVLLADVSREEAWNDRLRQYGLRLNIRKTEYLETEPSQGTIKVKGEDLPKTMSFRYLGSRLQCGGGVDDEVRLRVNAACMRWRKITGVLCDRHMPLRLKSKMYRTMVRPVALVGSDCWPATKSAELQHHSMKMRML